MLSALGIDWGIDGTDGQCVGDRILHTIFPPSSP